MKPEGFLSGSISVPAWLKLENSDCALNFQSRPFVPINDDREKGQADMEGREFIPRQSNWGFVTHPPFDVYCVDGIYVAYIVVETRKPDPGQVKLAMARDPKASQCDIEDELILQTSPRLRFTPLVVADEWVYSPRVDLAIMALAAIEVETKPWLPFDGLPAMVHDKINGSPHGNNLVRWVKRFGVDHIGVPEIIELEGGAVKYHVSGYQGGARSASGAIGEALVEVWHDYSNVILSIRLQYGDVTITLNPATMGVRFRCAHKTLGDRVAAIAEIRQMIGDIAGRYHKTFVDVIRSQWTPEPSNPARYMLPKNSQTLTVDDDGRIVEAIQTEMGGDE